MATTIRDYFRIEYKKRTVAQEACLWVGFTFLAVGIIGYVVQSLQGLIDTQHVNRVHDVMRVIFGALSIEMGMAKQTIIAERFSRWAGMILGLSGIAGFIIGHKGTLPVLMGFSGLGVERFLVRINFLKIEFGTIDHILHIFAATVFLLSVVPSKARAKG